MRVFENMVLKIFDERGMRWQSGGCRKLHNEEPSIIRMIELMRVRLTMYLTRMKKRNTCKIDFGW
jgi:hypothetical protein